MLTPPHQKSARTCYHRNMARAYCLYFDLAIKAHVVCAILNVERACCFAKVKGWKLLYSHPYKARTCSLATTLATTEEANSASPKECADLLPHFHGARLLPIFCLIIKAQVVCAPLNFERACCFAKVNWWKLLYSHPYKAHTCSLATALATTEEANSALPNKRARTCYHTYISRAY